MKQIQLINYKPGYLRKIISMQSERLVSHIFFLLSSTLLPNWFKSSNTSTYDTEF